MAGAALRVIDLDVLGRGLEQLLVGARRQHLSFHQQDDLVVVLDRRDLLRDRQQRDARDSSGARSRGSCARWSVSTRAVKSSSSSTRGLSASARASMMRCFWPPDRLVPRSDTMVSSFCGSAVDEVLQLRGRDRLLEVGVRHGRAEGDVLAQRQVEDDAVLEDEPDLPVQRLLVVVVDVAGRRIRRVPDVGVEQSGRAGRAAASCRPRSDR